jgi:hypothetical protein
MRDISPKIMSALASFASKVLTVLGVVLATLAFEDDIVRAPTRATRFKVSIGAWPNTRAAQKDVRRAFVSFWEQRDDAHLSHEEDACICKQLAEDAAEELNGAVVA